MGTILIMMFVNNTEMISGLKGRSFRSLLASKRIVYHLYPVTITDWHCKILREETTNKMLPSINLKLNSIHESFDVIILLLLLSL